MKAHIKVIEYALPERVLTNDELAARFPEWSIEKIKSKTGIDRRRIAADDECASDLAAKAAEKLFDKGVADRDDIDFILLCTQSPDYFLPTTACILQHRLGLPTRAGALDFNLGCSGFVYGLGVAKALVECGQAGNVLLLTAETYSKHIDPEDKSVRTIFGDGAAATIVAASEIGNIFSPDYGTDGSGMNNLIVPEGGMRSRSPKKYESFSPYLSMNGSEIFAFTLARIPSSIDAALVKSNLQMNDIDLFVFHQANAFMLEHLRKKCGILEEKFFVSFSDIGNTVSSTIPIALKRAEESGKLRRGMRVMLSGFGVGYSWASCVIVW